MFLHRRPPIWLALWLLALISVPLEVRLYAAIAVVQTDTDGATGNDAIITFGSNTTSGNVVLLASVLGAQTDTMDVTGISETETVIHGPADFSTLRGYLFCITVTNPDTTYVMETSGTGGAHSIGIEVSNATCTEDGTSQANATTSTTSHALTTDITIADGSVIWGIVRSTNGADFTADAGVTSTPASNAEVGSETLGGYRIEVTGGAFDLPFTSAGNETTLIMAGAVTASGGGGGGGTAAHRLLLRCCDQ
jgi:hypothetical protein